jgi:hypothetical protein
MTQLSLLDAPQTVYAAHRAEARSEVAHDAEARVRRVQT